MKKQVNGIHWYIIIHIYLGTGFLPLKFPKKYEFIKNKDRKKKSFRLKEGKKPLPSVRLDYLNYFDFERNLNTELNFVQSFIYTFKKKKMTLCHS